MIITRGSWTPDTEALIASALSTAGLADIKREVEDTASLWVLCDDDAETLAAFVLRVDQLADGCEGVVLAAGGKADFDLTAVVMPHIEKMFVGCKSMRVHTERMGLVKKLKLQSWYLAEMVMRKELNG